MAWLLYIPADSFEHVLLVLEATAGAAMREVQARVAVAYPIYFLLAILPALLLLARHWLRRGRGTANAQNDGATAKTALSLRVAHRSAAQRGGCS